MTVIIPMAGKGERFSKAGYKTPKPLIKVDNLPMVIKAVNDLPKADNYIFIVLEDHLKQGIDTEIKSVIPNAEFIILQQVTEGQACTCMTALPSIPEDEEILIGACDNGMIYDESLFKNLKEECDAIIFTFRNNVTVVNKPHQYGWVKSDAENLATEVAVKKPISNTPIKDHAIIGAFWFKAASIFKTAAEKMIKENRRINNEFYVDELMNDVIELGYKVKVLEVDKYICWGTPDDYESYCYWKSFFTNKKFFK